MKKNILLIVAALFLFLGNQSVSAQAKLTKETQSTSSVNAEAKAKKMTTSLIRPLDLNDKQQKQVYSLFAKIEDKMSSVNTNDDVQKQTTMQIKIDKYVNGKMKEILTEEQYEKYLVLAKDL